MNVIFESKKHGLGWVKTLPDADGVSGRAQFGTLEDAVEYVTRYLDTYPDDCNFFFVKIENVKHLEVKTSRVLERGGV